MDPESFVGLISTVRADTSMLDFNEIYRIPLQATKYGSMVMMSSMQIRSP